MKNEVQYTDSQVNTYHVEMCTYLHGCLSVDIRENLAKCLNISERACVFMDYLCSLGSTCFRWNGGGGLPRNRRSGVQNSMEGAYCFGGMVWEQIDGVKFKIALKDFCLRELGMSASEWLRGTEKYVQSVREGAMLSPLGLSKSIVGFRNGVYDFGDMSNIVYHPFSDRMPVTELLDYDYEAGAKCPLWQGFLGTILSKKDILLLQKFFALGLVDREKMSRKIENTLWLVGPGGVGKSTILNTITEVFGRNSVSAASMGDLLSPNAVTRPLVINSIVGKIFNMCGEVQAASMSGGKADGFKSLCSGEPQPVRGIGKDYELRSDIPYMVFSMNKKPKLSRIDNAITRRILFVSFRTMIREEDRDTELGNKLRGELSGIRNWLMQGYRQLEKDGFRLEQPARDADESDAWLEENGQTVTLFLKKNDIRPYAYAGNKEDGRWWLLKVLHAQYCEFCKKWGYEAVTDIAMGSELRELGYRKERKAAGMVYYLYGGGKLI